MQLSMKSLYLHEINLEQLETTESSYYDSDTKRRKILRSEILLWGRWKECISCWSEKWGRWQLCKNCYQDQRKVQFDIRCWACWTTCKRQLGAIRKALKKWQKDMYCNKKCSWAVYIANHWTPCIWCWWPRSPKKRKKYCSDECRLKTLQARKKIIECLHCWSSLNPRSYKTKFCSMECKNDHHSKTMLWVWNSNYRHWLALDNYPNEFYKMRSLVLKRDGNKCVICWTCERLAIHHKDRNPKNNVIENLVTVCATDHAIHHWSKISPYPQLNA